MTYRPYPNAARTLRNLRHQQAVYMYGRVPQRYVLGLDAATSPHSHFVMDGEVPTVEECQAAADPILERGYVMTTVVGEDGFDDVYGEAPPVGEYRLSSRPGVVGGGQ